MLPEFDLASTLIILPCSKRKAQGGLAFRAPGIVDELPGNLKAEFVSARRRAAQIAKLDDSRLLPAWRRYVGDCYQTKAAEQAVAIGARALILSGGYGILLPTESIGWYCRTLHLSDWGGHLLERCIEAYATKHGLRIATAFMARTGNYAKVIRRWGGLGVDSAYLVSPDTVERRTSQKLVAMGYGEALRAFLQGTLCNGWSSESGVHVGIEQLK